MAHQKVPLDPDAAIRRGEQFLAAEPDELKAIVAEYRSLLESYRRLVGKLNKIISISDAYHSQSKEDQRQLSAALDRNQLLLKEVNHRVKNNLSVVVSLLNLQSSQVKDPHDADLFRVTEQRVKVMARIHELLYRSITLDRLSAGEFFTAIAKQLLHSYSRSDLTLQVECGDLLLDLDNVLPCGLIVNELVTNSLKYGFLSGRTGVIGISLVQHGGDFTLTVKDDGVGLPDGFAPERCESLGIVLVTALVRQLGGTLFLSEGGGAGFIIRFPSG